MTYLSIILTILTILATILTIYTFFINRKKDNANEGKRSGAFEQKVDDIATRTEEIQRDVRELRERDRLTSELAIAIQESVKSAHKRIDGLEKRIEK